MFVSVSYTGILNVMPFIEPIPSSMMPTPVLFRMGMLLLLLPLLLPLLLLLLLALLLALLLLLRLLWRFGMVDDADAEGWVYVALDPNERAAVFVIF